MKATVIFLLVLLFLFMASFTGCGRKTPPVYSEKVPVNYHIETAVSIWRL